MRSPFPLALLGVSAFVLIASHAGCATPATPRGLRAAIGPVVDLRAAEPGALGPREAKLFGEMLGRKLAVRDRFGADAVPHRQLMLSTELLSATWREGPSPVAPLGGTTYLPVPSRGNLLEARVRVHLRNAAGGAPLKSYVIKRVRFQSDPLNPADLAVLAELVAQEVHAVIERDLDLLLQAVRAPGSPPPGLITTPPPTTPSTSTTPALRGSQL
jgi:hypothetical protein